MKNIVLIEDDKTIAKLVTLKLEKEGYKVTWKENGLDGLNEVKKKLPDLALIDIMLPKLDGFQILEDLKNNPKTKAIATILMTALSQDEKIEKAYDLGVDDFIIKPFLPSDLINRVKKILSNN
ncbi:response regulator transcription factor [Candidatus Margulisiibacteriota bacterium]